MFWPLQASGTFMVHLLCIGKTLIHINKKIKKRRSSSNGLILALLCLGWFVWKFSLSLQDCQVVESTY